MKPPRPKPIYAGTPPRVVGTVEGGVFTKPVHGSRHMLLSPLAWSMDVVTFQEALNAGADFVLIQDKDTGIEYRASTETIVKKGFRLDRGHGPQVALGLAHWEATPPKPVQRKLW